VLLTRPRVENTLLVGPGGVKSRRGKIIIAHHRQNRRQVSSRRRLIKAAATSSSSSESKNDSFDEENERNMTASAFQLSPMQPSSAVGTHLRNVLERNPNAFEDALEKQLRLWAEALGEEEEKEEKEKTTALVKEEEDKDEDLNATNNVNVFSDRAFSKLRKKREVEDALYLCVAEKKAQRGVELTIDFENVRLRRSGLVKRCQVLSSEFLPAGSEDILNKHLIGVLSNVSTNGGLNPENFEKYIPKVVLAHVYQRSAAYGYFLRRVEKRYNVERLFSEKTTAFIEEEKEEEEKRGKSAESIAPPSNNNNGLKRTLNFRARPRLRKRENDIAHGKVEAGNRNDEFCIVDEAAGTRTCVEPQLHSFKAYIESLDPEVRARAARIESAEARGALERHVEALFGAQASNSNELSERMRELELLITKTSTRRALSKNEYGRNRESDDDDDDDDETDARLRTSYFEIETMEMTLDNLKHLVIEACAFGGELAVAEDRFDGIDGGVLNR
jgi:hypothetical protein